MNRSPDLKPIEPAKGGDAGLCELLNEMIDVINALIEQSSPLGFGGDDSGGGSPTVYATVISDGGDVTLNPVTIPGASVGAPVTAADL
jgi:hypothetical protein